MHFNTISKGYIKDLYYLSNDTILDNSFGSKISKTLGVIILHFTNRK